MAVSVGFIGLGNMGNPMAGNILKNGYAMAVFDLNSKAAANLVAAGAKLAASAIDVAKQTDVIFTSLPGSPEVESTYLQSGGLIDHAKSGSTLVDLSSTLPSTP